jgi:phospholipase/carboxylesterase
MAALQRRQLSLVHRVRPPGLASPADERPPLLILLHGVGSNELAVAGLADAFDPRLMIVSARSPREVGRFAFAWFDVTFTPDGPIIDGDQAQQAWQHLSSFVDEAVAAYGADDRRVFVAGFSQGGIVALSAMLTAPERYAGVVCMSGRLPPEVLPFLAQPERLGDKPILIVHGVHDDVLGIDFARSARAILATLPVSVSYQELDLGHSTSPESIDIVGTWLTDQLDRLEWDPAPERSGSVRPDAHAAPDP